VHWRRNQRKRLIRTILINWEVVNISLPTLAYCKYDVIWRQPYEANKHNFYTFKKRNESAQFVSNISVTNQTFECLGHPHYKEFCVHAENISSI
jgi:hypothetical protein